MLMPPLKIMGYHVQLRPAPVDRHEMRTKKELINPAPHGYYPARQHVGIKKEPGAPPLAQRRLPFFTAASSSAIF